MTNHTAHQNASRRSSFRCLKTHQTSGTRISSRRCSFPTQGSGRAAHLARDWDTQGRFDRSRHPRIRSKDHQRRQQSRKLQCRRRRSKRTWTCWNSPRRLTSGKVYPPPQLYCQAQAPDFPGVSEVVAQAAVCSCHGPGRRSSFPFVRSDFGLGKREALRTPPRNRTRPYGFLPTFQDYPTTANRLIPVSGRDAPIF